MGISFMAKGLSEENSISCSYTTFNDFRIELAKAYNEEFGELYEKWCGEGITKDEKERIDEISNEDLNIFLTISDTFGEFTPQECKKIYDAIEDLKIDNGYEIILGQLKNIFLYSYKNMVKLSFA